MITSRREDRREMETFCDSTARRGRKNNTTLASIDLAGGLYRMSSSTCSGL